MDSKAFFDAIRPLYAPKLTQSEVSGVNAILAACTATATPTAFTAYMLATAYWETKHAMQPIDEDGGNGYFFRRYDPQGAFPEIAHQLGNTQKGDGVLFHGRGLVQVTGRANYFRIGNLIGVDLVTNPDKAKEPATAIRVMHDGMVFGWFTGRRLGQYLPKVGVAGRNDFIMARYVINGQDQAATIADVAMRFQSALSL